MKSPKFIAKIVALVLVIILVVCLLILFVLAKVSYQPNRQIIYGVTFSSKFAQYLNLNWQTAYLAMLDDLKIKYLRLPSYWEDIEPALNIYDWQDLDWQINEAEKRGVKIILVVGRRQPRWPECHDPDWVPTVPEHQVRQEILDYIKQVVNRYKNRVAIEMWQVENEPFLDFFGECPKISKQELEEEIALVKSLDNRKVMLTDSGELSSWYPLIGLGDVFGTTLYRTTYNKIIGYWRYFFIPPGYYRAKAAFWRKPLDGMYVAELQAEPWFPNGPLNTPLAEHYKTMDAEQLVKNAQFANKTNFFRSYFWGVEWWYWLMTAQKDDSVWEAAKQFFP